MISRYNNKIVGNGSLWVSKWTNKSFINISDNTRSVTRPMFTCLVYFEERKVLEYEVSRYLLIHFTLYTITTLDSSYSFFFSASYSPSLPNVKICYTGPFLSDYCTVHSFLEFLHSVTRYTMDPLLTSSSSYVSETHPSYDHTNSLWSFRSTDLTYTTPHYLLTVPPFHWLPVFTPHNILYHS